MLIKASRQQLWPTDVGFYEAPVGWEVHKTLVDHSLAASPKGTLSSKERRVRGILDNSDAGQVLEKHIRSCVHDFLGDYASMVDPDYCENRALVINQGSFLSTHKDSREGDVTCIYFLTGSGEGSPINSAGDPQLVLEDSTRYFDEARLPFESRHGYSVNPRAGLAVVFPSYVPHNQHPYRGTVPHVQIVANYRVQIPDEIEERMFD